LAFTAVCGLQPTPNFLNRLMKRDRLLKTSDLFFERLKPSLDLR
jgi:hypothetical protein